MSHLMATWANSRRAKDDRHEWAPEDFLPAHLKSEQAAEARELTPEDYRGNARMYAEMKIDQARKRKKKAEKLEEKRAKKGRG